MHKYPYFEGWYCKHQNRGQTIAFIPAFHINRSGKLTASIQVITDEGSWMVDYPGEQVRVGRKTFAIQIGENYFAESGIHIDLETDGLIIRGDVHYGPFHKIQKDIMGPFRFVPFMECYHGIVSMSHSLSGSLIINGKALAFTGGRGYIETDRGYSFPKDYLWTQCSFKYGSLMISAADIPFLGFHFKGCICAVHYQGLEYRIATYRGARIRKYTEDEIWLKQGPYEIRAAKLGERGFHLQAPRHGNMSRKVFENPSCPVRYQMFHKGQQIFDIAGSQASFESAVQR